MASIGKKIISAFLEVEEKKDAAVESSPQNAATPDDTTRDAPSSQAVDKAGNRFTGHFDKLLGEANIPGPDYYEFARMIAVMRSIPDEAARYNAAFAGLQAQGLSKERLLDTASAYLKVLATDAEQFQKTIDASYEEKVREKETEAQEKSARIQSLSQEIMQLQQRIGALQDEIRVSKEKLAGSSSGYSAESGRRQHEIRADIEKISHYIH